MAQGAGVSISLPATARRLPPISKGDVAECPRCPQKAVLLSPQQEFLSRSLNQPAGGQTGERETLILTGVGKRVITHQR